MTDSEARTRTTAVETKGAPTIDMKLEVVVIPVSDVDRAKFMQASDGGSTPTSPPETTGA